MNYEPETYDTIFEQMLDDSVENGLISKAEDFPSLIKNRKDISNYYIMDKAVIAQAIAKIYQYATEVYNSHNIFLATGIDLDHIGDSLGIPRPQATHASVQVTFTVQSDEEISIPEGVIVSTNSGIEYMTVERIYIPSTSSQTTVSCMSVEAGTNIKVVPNSLTNIVSKVHRNLSCTNENASSGGTNEYSDDEYRELLLNWRLIDIRGSLEAYEYFFINFDGIDGYKLIPNWNGTGTMKVILDPGDPYLLLMAYNGLQQTVTQATEDISMFAPIGKYIDVHATVNVDIDQINPYSEVEKEDIKSRIISAVKIFIDGGYRRDGTWYSGLNIGEDFIPHKLGVFLDSEIPELKHITFKYPRDYIAILDEEIGVSKNVKIEMI
ncbi:baseplate J/gp47 family protein [Methanobrevibacter sp.]